MPGVRDEGSGEPDFRLLFESGLGLTVKEMLAAILRMHFGDAHVLATQGNLNNAIGLDINTPLTVTEQGAVTEPPGVSPPGPPGAGGNQAGNGEPAPGRAQARAGLQARRAPGRAAARRALLGSAAAERWQSTP